MNETWINRTGGSVAYSPESIAVQYARYPMALQPVFHVESFLRGDSPRPDQVRSCVFDSFDGLRLIVSHEVSETRGKVLHLAGWLHEPSELHHQAEAGVFDSSLFALTILERFATISLDRGSFAHFPTETPGVYHFIRPWDPGLKAGATERTEY